MSLLYGFTSSAPFDGCVHCCRVRAWRLRLVKGGFVMRLADVVFRRGHLSEAALVEVWNTGMRPAHLDRCDICAERALEISHWLEDVQALGRAGADAVFTPERLTAQRGQI